MHDFALKLMKIYIIFDFYEHTILGIYTKVVNMNDSDHNALHRGNLGSFFQKGHGGTTT